MGDEPLDIGRIEAFSTTRCDFSATEKQLESKEKKQEHTSTGRGMSLGPSLSQHVENLQQLGEQVGMKSVYFLQANEDHETFISRNMFKEDRVMEKRKSSGESVSKSGTKSFKAFHSASNREIEDTEKTTRVAEYSRRNKTELNCLKASTSTGESSSYISPDTQGPSVIREILPFVFDTRRRGLQEYPNLNIDTFPEVDMEYTHLLKSGVSYEMEFIKPIEKSKVTIEERLELGLVSHTIKGNNILESRDSNKGFHISSEISDVAPNLVAGTTNNDFEYSSYTDIQDKMRESNVSLSSENTTKECICHRSSASSAQCMCLTPSTNTGASCNDDYSLIGHFPDTSQTVHFVCKLCGGGFSSQSDLMPHLRTCLLRRKQCNQTFVTKQTLGINIRRHNNDKPFKCDDCKKAFVTKFELLSHIATHTGRKFYKCEYCETWFSRISKLELHIRRHKNDKPFVCSDCGKPFTTYWELKNHSIIHTRKSNFKCLYCARCFTSKGCLEIHIRRHNNDRPFVCEVCNAAFCSSGEMKRHFRKHTR